MAVLSFPSHFRKADFQRAARASGTFSVTFNCEKKTLASGFYSAVTHMVIFFFRLHCNLSVKIGGRGGKQNYIWMDFLGFMRLQSHRCFRLPLNGEQCHCLKFHWTLVFSSPFFFVNYLQDAAAVVCQLSGVEDLSPRLRGAVCGRGLIAARLNCAVF